ncbi:MAG: NADH-quinone oxidoreductase subunit J [Saprospiraceae bacterium]|jgi:NADH-quinone oxidoreductase subunit J|nr:NADH-quinone oxidoreductase subunit J [Saprospiraceae bacterium]MBX7178421.1 NADH-quinone oxidoreductase subunit J [Saprospiraceae bacterium]MCB0591379.1 NADH-quinone oxidoreductase subunit J [Saprospiraceae bacterium]MCO5283696.1 NADH-quinone oxidoreductase subunit J [Saprospiraceae bacterium]MCO6469419.1 NADH-quinone oxidoreductase subunit J [Saprospiraceae bacterium]
MNIIFYIASIVALIATIRVVTHKDAVHALLYLVVSLLAISVIFFIVGAPFVAALEVIVYAGAIMVLFVFAIMMLNLGKDSVKQEASLFSPRAWIVPSILCLVLLVEIIYVLAGGGLPGSNVKIISAQEVSNTMFKGYVLAVELTGMLLMAGIVGAYHIGKEKRKEYHRYLQINEDENE